MIVGPFQHFRCAFVVLIIGVLSCTSSLAQSRCGTVEYTRKLKGASEHTDRAAFEKWMQRKIAQHKNLPKSQPSGRSETAQYNIPVVVHIIHNGEPVGTGTNLSDAQVQSQISVLNKDYNRINTDASQTPADFLPVAGSMDIQFVLARQDPQGLATNGIVRVKGSKKSWIMADNYELKSLSYWPSEDYLNIWVCNITDFIGYTQFPESPLPGLEGSSPNAGTDGIVIWYRAFGSEDDGAFSLDPAYTKGRTATHEVGHFFGLRHIWGDDAAGCDGTDYVDDTPNQAGSTGGCPTHPKADNCIAAKMFQNYLDYTDDRCMNLFTKGQVARMMTLIDGNTPRRTSLLTSHGLNEPVPVPNDLGIQSIIAPQPTSCTTLFTPSMEVRNYGSNTVSSATIEERVDGVVRETKTVSLSLGALASAQVTFAPVTLSPGDHQFRFAIQQVNNTNDGQNRNDTISVTTYVAESATLPLAENFNTLPPKWTVDNPDQEITWSIAAAPSDEPGNKALFLDFYDYSDHYGELDAFISPVLDLSSVNLASLVFEVAYSTFQGANDRLKVIVLQNCEELTEGTVIYDKGGPTLATVSGSQPSFVPVREDDWRKELINLSQFAGQGNLRIAFVGINDWGNNLYLDNVAIVTGELEDLNLKALASPGPVTCDTQPAPQITVQNVGTVTITSFSIQYSVNGGALSTLPVTGDPLSLGEEQVFFLPAVNLQAGLNSIFVNLINPNGTEDQTPANNQFTFTVEVNNPADRIPYRENFDGAFADQWTQINPTNGEAAWDSIHTNFKQSAYVNAFDNRTPGDETWLVSPVLDFARTDQASMVFDISYATREGRQDVLDILVSADCGDTYFPVPDFSLFDFTFPDSESPWVPSKESDWEKNITVNLDDYAGQPGVRVAFVFTNANGNNLYLDNIEFYTTDEPDTIEVAAPYSIYGYNLSEPVNNELKITFNLDQRQDVGYSVVDLMGHSFAQGVFPDVLNQTYPLQLEQNLSPGMYVVRLRIGARYYAEKVLVAR